MFDEVREALARGDDDRALEKGLEVWRETRITEVGAFVCRLANAMGPSPLKERTKVRFHAEWMARAAHPSALDVGVLAESLTEKLPVEKARRHYDHDVEAQYAPLFERVEALRRLGPDPRIGWAMVDHIRRGALRVGWEGDGGVIYGPMVLALEESVDGDIAAAVHAIADNPTASSEGLRRWQRSSLRRVQFMAARPDGMPWDTLLPGDDGPSAAAGEILVAIHEQPDERGLKEVYADILQAASDPRGRFISLQLEGTGEARKQAGKLLRKHQKEWLGPDLCRALVHVAFDEGFLSGAEVGQNARCDAAGWKRAFIDSRLGTLRTLRKGRGNTRNYMAFLESGGAPHLRDVEAPSLATLRRVCEAGLPIERLEVQARMPKGNRLAPLARLADTLQELTVTWGRDAKAAPVFRRWRRDLDTFGSDGLREIFVRLDHNAAVADDFFSGGLANGFDAVGFGYPWGERWQRIRRDRDGSLRVEFGCPDVVGDLEGWLEGMEGVVAVRIHPGRAGKTFDTTGLQRAFPEIAFA